MDRLGLAIGGEYRAYSFLKLEAGYEETHFRNLGDCGMEIQTPL